VLDIGIVPLFSFSALGDRGIRVLKPPFKVETLLSNKDLFGSSCGKPSVKSLLIFIRLIIDSRGICN
jgi:hypothetical protein